LAKQRPINTNTESLTFKERLQALSNLPAFFKLVWETSKWMTTVSFVLRLIRSAMPVSLLYIGKLIIDQVVFLSHTHGNTYHLWQLVGLEFVLAIATDGLSRAITLMDSLLGDLFGNHSSVRIMAHAATLDLDQFEDAVFYDKLERARQQTTGRTILLSLTMSQVQDIITLAFLAVGLMAFNPWLIILLLFAIIPAFLGESHFNTRNYLLTRGQTPERRELDYVRYLGASDDTAKEIKIFDLSGFIINRFKELSGNFYKESKRLSIQRSLWGTFFAMLGSVGYYAAYVFIIIRAVEGQVTIGELAFLAGSFRQLRAYLEGILTRFTAVSQGAVYLKDFFEFFDIEPKIKLSPNALPFPKVIKQGFVFENVGFKYHNSERWANRHLNFTLFPGEKLALVGENGAGKTTLVKLLSRLYDPTEGRILLDGVDLKQYNLTDLRLNIGIIFQDYLRYQMTFAQNIAVGNINKLNDRELIERSAKQSLADVLSAKLPGGYDQQLGKRFADGVELSGGEWQKVALARAYMRDAQLLILDEPTSALDARAEYEVFQRFADLTKGKSAILISHRFSTVRMADRILVLEKGELKEIGSHEELLAKGGIYAELFDLQAAGYR
jgi:ATP-binding cassette subfamily B protein